MKHYDYVTKKGILKRYTETQIKRNTVFAKRDSEDRRKYKIKTMKRLIKYKSVTPNTKIILATRLGIPIITPLFAEKARIEPQEKVKETRTERKEELADIGLKITGLISGGISYRDKANHNFFYEFKFTATLKNKNVYDEVEMFQKAEELMRELFNSESRLNEGLFESVRKHYGIEMMEEMKIEEDKIFGELYYAAVDDSTRFLKIARRYETRM